MSIEYLQNLDFEELEIIHEIRIGNLINKSENLARIFLLINKPN